MQTARPQYGFTLIELLVVCSIIAVLIATLLPAIGKAKASAKNALCMANQRQLAQTTYYYASDYKNYVPAQYDNTSVAGCYWFQKLAVGFLNVSMQGSAPDSLCGNGKGGDKIFICPEAPESGADGLLRRSIGYGWNFYALTYFDGVYADTYGQTARFSDISVPAETVLTGDGSHVGYLNQYVIWGLSNPAYVPLFRHNDKAFFSMADGHVVALGWNPVMTDYGNVWKLKR